MYRAIASASAAGTSLSSTPPATVSTRMPLPAGAGPPSEAGPLKESSRSNAGACCVASGGNVLTKTPFAHSHRDSTDLKLAVSGTTSPPESRICPFTRE